MNKFYKKFNDRGSTLVLVVVAMGFITILASLVMTVSVAGHQMKVMDALAKKNQYSTETLLNQVCSGLQEVAEDKMMQAYTYGLTRYAATPNSEKADLVNKKYVDYMEAELRSKSGVMDSYVPTVAPDGTKTITLSVAQQGTLVAWLNSLTPTNSGFLQNDKTSKIVLKKNEEENKENFSATLTNITVESQDRGYATRITTDIKLGAPSLIVGGAGAIVSTKKLEDYILVADGKIRVTGGGGSTVHGSVYGGAGIVGESGKVTFMGKKLLSRGALEAVGGGRIVIMPMDPRDPSQVWVNDIKTTKVNSGGAEVTPRAQLSITATCNVANDLTMNNPACNVSIAGKYYGYGFAMSNKAESFGSSIGVNAPGVTLDLRGLTELWLAGRSSISVEGSDELGVSKPITPIAQGEAISYIWTQNAYLLPGDCIPGIGHNPMTLEEHERWKTMEAGDQFNITKYIPVALRKYLKEGDPYKKVFVRHQLGSEGTDMVYFYMNFASPRYASEYFREYAEGKAERGDMEAIATYMGFKGITFNDTITDKEGKDKKFLVGGNIVNLDQVETMNSMMVDNGAPVTSAEFYDMSNEKPYIRNGLMGYLDETQLVPELPKTKLVEGILNLETIKNKPVNQRNFIASSGDYTLNQTQFNGMIVADGDVTINGAVTGLILATGDIKINSSASYTAEPGIFGVVGSSVSNLQEYFRIAVGGETGSNKPPVVQGAEAGRVVISFENWRKS